MAGTMLWSICLAFLVSFRAEALPVQGKPLREVLSREELDHSDTDPLFIRLSDDPAAFMHELLDLWGRVSAEKEPLLKARIGWWIGRIDASYSFIDIGQILPETITIIEKSAVRVSAADLKYFDMQHRISQEPRRFIELKDQELELVRHMQDPHSRSFALTRVAYAMGDRRLELSQLASLINEIMDMAKFSRQSIDPPDIDTLQLLSVTLASMGQVKEAEEISRRLDQLCTAGEIRKLCAMRAYNAGLDATHKSTETGGAEGVAFFLKAIALAEKIPDKLLVAFSNYGLCVAYNKTGNYPKAIEIGIKSSAFFETTEMKDWAASSYRNLSISYLGNKDPEQALKAVQKALALCPPEFKGDLKSIYYQLAEVNEALKNYQEAHKSLKSFIGIEKQLSTEDATKKYMELRNESLTKQNEWQGEQIQLLSKFRLVSLIALTLSLLVCGALVLVWRQAGVIRRSRRKMKEVLDHIDEGIVTLDERLRIESGYSPHLDKIFDQPAEALKDALLLDLLFSTDSTGEGILARETLVSCMGGESLSWELNRGHLPAEVTQGSSILGLHWLPLFNSKGLITRYLVSIRDITALRTVEKMAKQESERVQAMQKKLEEILGGSIHQIRALFTELKQEWDSFGDRLVHESERVLSLRRLHTWKGAARTLGLKYLAGRLHEMEACLVPAAEFSIPLIREKWQALSFSVVDYEHLLNTLLVSKAGAEQAASDLYAYANLYAGEMKERLDGAACPQVGVMVLDHVLRWKPEVLPKVHQMLLHAVSNAIDHGFIRPLLQHKKTAPALIQIQALPMENHIELRVIDNGAGINWPELKKKAERLGIVSGSSQSYADLLFQDGVSTAVSTSETSGRGVGLSALRSLCSELKGSCFLEDATGGGTALRLEFPASSLVEIPIQKNSRVDSIPA